MLERKVYHQLVEWKNSQSKICLVVMGARGVGKTYLIEQFAQDYYENYITINFEKNPEYKVIFNGELDVKNLIKQISLRIPNASIVPYKTLIFLDEIQNCPRAIETLRFLAKSKKFDVIASTSLLNLDFPADCTQQIEMNALDFEEFLWANHITKEKVLELKKFFEQKEVVPVTIHEKMMALFREYIVVGGMPKVVNDFMKNHNFARVLKIQKSILNDYQEEMKKQTDGDKIKECFASIPQHLEKDYKKFRYSLVSPKGSSRKYVKSVQWLLNEGIINLCYNLSKPQLPLKENVRDDVFKVYMKDTGLLLCMLEEGSQTDIIDGNLGICKGGVYENIIADMFAKNHHPLYYFEYNSTLEIDFFLEYENVATAIAVKSAENSKAKSLEAVMKNYSVPKGIKLAPSNYRNKNGIDIFPIYMAMFL